MKRKFRRHEILTPFGPVVVLPLGANEVRVSTLDTPDLSPNALLELDGARFSVNAHLVRDEAGSWAPRIDQAGRQTRFQIHKRVLTFGKFEANRSQTRTIEDAVLQTVGGWASEHPSSFIHAAKAFPAVVHAAIKVQAAREALVAAEQEAAEALARHTQRLAELKAAERLNRVAEPIPTPLLTPGLLFG